MHFFQQNDPATRRLSKMHIYMYSIGKNSAPRPPKTSHHLPNCGQRFLSNLSQKFDRFRRQAPTRQVTVPADAQCPLILATGPAGARDQRSGSEVISGVVAAGAPVLIRSARRSMPVAQPLAQGQCYEISPPVDGRCECILFCAARMRFFWLVADGITHEHVGFFRRLVFSST